MKVSILNEKVNPLLKRKELEIEIDHTQEATPAKAALQTFLSKELKAEPERIEIKNIFTDNGRANSKTKIFLWEEKKVEDLSKVKKEEKPKEEPKEKPVEKKEEKPKEKKEEVKKEEKIKEETKPKTEKEGKPKEDKKIEEKKEIPKEEKKAEEKEEIKEGAK